MPACAATVCGVCLLLCLAVRRAAWGLATEAAWRRLDKISGLSSSVHERSEHDT